MHMQSIKRAVCLLVVAAILGQAIWSGGTHAAMVTTEAVVQALGPAGLEAGATPRDRLLDLLRREEVRAELEALGIDPEEAAARVRSLNDREVAGLLGRIDRLPAGAGLCDGTSTVEECLFFGGAIVAAIVFLIFIAIAIAAGAYWLFDSLAEKADDPSDDAQPPDHGSSVAMGADR